MFGIIDLIVSLWLLPVILFVVLPMGMLCLWVVAHFARKMLTIFGVAIEYGRQEVELKNVSAVKA
ncbi:hypothetical protein [Desulfofustis glycolicus]|uniref:Uncharacterized protein n=1 Tax=Desulfofustis glycolicus DSM 9705 TaxID=1121409 RepID=A0A1M5YCJ4_9BACT|nr:hypothetical protein [Desulfofustis glycolicus]MCB2215515.1 hypothetical protein [Desulfobulbaceae bacterium]SHI09692.1 hypothetical protein SAMN02745124_03862 [Desulfofustis glycolicus DSM 9705]